MTVRVFIDAPRRDARGARWSEPRLVVEVEFSEWTRDGRAPASFQGIREDKMPRDVRREVEAKVA